MLATRIILIAGLIAIIALILLSLPASISGLVLPALQIISFAGVMVLTGRKLMIRR